ncbi:MAG TPA: hypothetical protein VK699_01695 [Terriglobales bacterium]|nr:hypothetical protein [Terriglobales bacterium]
MRRQRVAAFTRHLTAAFALFGCKRVAGLQTRHQWRGKQRDRQQQCSKFADPFHVK